MAQPPKFAERTLPQKVGPFNKRVAVAEDQDVDETEWRSKRRPRAAELLAGGQELDLPGPSRDIVEFTHQYDGGDTGLSYMEKLQALEYGEKTKDPFFNQESFVIKFGYSITFRMRIGFDTTCQSYKLYIRKENLKDKNMPTVATIMLSELKEILDYIRDTLKLIDESVEKKEPLFHYGPKEIRNPRSQEFWAHDDGFLSTSISARMRFLHVRNDRYQLFINSPIVETSKRYDDYLGPILTWCRADIDQFLVAVDSLLEKIDPAEL